MKILQINAVCEHGSTGKICVGISKLLSNENIENTILYAVGESSYPLSLKYETQKQIFFDAFKSYVTGKYGFNSQKATYDLLNVIKDYSPDIVHLHNIHSHNCNLEILFDYFKVQSQKVLWTFHDCWAFTGYCPHFTMVGCHQWQSECFNCPQYKEYSVFFDRSGELFRRKKALFSDLDMTIVTPSRWLSGMVSRSFLNQYPVHVINNGIDLNVFRPVENSSWKKDKNIENKNLILGVSFDWGRKKGLDIFVELSKRLDPNRYQIVLVGTNDRLDKKLPRNIISIHRTKNQNELAAVYSAADIFVNPTREENFPTVNIEALSCGTPVVTFRTGGSPEIIDETCGSVVDVDDIGELENEIVRCCTEKPYSGEACRKRAEKFDQNDKFQEYIELYRRIYDGFAEN